MSIPDFTTLNFLLFLHFLSFNPSVITTMNDFYIPHKPFLVTRHSSWRSTRPRIHDARMKPHLEHAEERGSNTTSRCNPFFRLQNAPQGGQIRNHVTFMTCWIGCSSNTKSLRISIHVFEWGHFHPSRVLHLHVIKINSYCLWPLLCSESNQMDSEAGSVCYVYNALCFKWFFIGH